MMIDPNAAHAADNVSPPPAAHFDDDKLLRAVEGYLSPRDVKYVRAALAFARELANARPPEPAPTVTPAKGEKAEKGAPAPRPRSPSGPWDIGYALGVAETLADAIHIDAISLAAVLLYQAVESRLTRLADVRQRLGDEYGIAVAQTIENIERFDTLQRPGVELRRHARAQAALSGDGDDSSRDRGKGSERQRQMDAENVRKMFVAMAEDPRVAVFKIADQLRTMRAVRDAAEQWHAFPAASDGAVTAVPPGAATPAWTEDECRRAAQETRDVFAPLAGRLGMGRVEGELEDLAFAVLEPDEFATLRETVAEYTQERNSYVERVVGVLRDEMAKLGLRAEVSGRVKHLYSIYKKVKRSEDADLSSLYDILAFRVIVPTVADCYLALGHVHGLWPPKDGRFKDFIATPKPNGYKSLHTTVFCLDSRLAEIQIRTPEMHQMAEYGVAMHWYYKDVGDTASAQAASLKNWVEQVKHWQDELARPAHADRTVAAVAREMLKERIFVYTPAGDVKDVPAGATPLDFAYLIHSDVGNHVAGARVSTTDGNGRLARRLVPLDYELRSGDVVEILTRKDAHPTRDWLKVVGTKSARDKINRYLKDHERDIDRQIGHERLDRDLRLAGLRKGYDDLTEADLEWAVEEFQQPNVDALLVAIGAEKLKVSAVVARLRERLFPAAPAETPSEATVAPREPLTKASVAGMEGMLTRLASCCNPLPGDDLLGFVSRGRGVVIHRADCPNLAHLLAGEPDREVAVSWPEDLTEKQTFRAPIVVVAADRPGLLMDVTGVITGQKINMVNVTTTTNARQHRAVITATLEVSRPEQAAAVITALQKVTSVQTVERKRPKPPAGGRSPRK